MAERAAAFSVDGSRAAHRAAGLLTRRRAAASATEHPHSLSPRAEGHLAVRIGNSDAALEYSFNGRNAHQISAGARIRGIRRAIDSRPMPIVLYSATVVCPMAGPPLTRGGVLVHGETIVAVGDAAALRTDADRVHHIEGALLPGLVNAHTHLEYSDASELAQPAPFHSWIRALVGLTADWDEARWTRSARRGVQQLLRAGVTAVGDVVSRGPAVPASARAGLTGDSWVEVVMVDARHQDEVLAAVERALSLPAQGRRIGIAPHAVYTLGTEVLRAFAALADRADVPLHIHCAETREEVSAIASGAGPHAEVARRNGMSFEWLDGGTGRSPVAHLDALGALTPRTTLAHGVWIDDREARLLADRGVAVVCCPRSNAMLQAGAAPLERYAAAGTSLALGTDSAASAPDLDLLAEAAAWAQLAHDRGLALWPSAVGPIPLAEQAIRLATAEGARAMGWGRHAGLLQAGRRADLVGIEIDTSAERVYTDLVERGPGRQVMTVVGGIRKARRASADVPWPEIEHEDLQ